MSIKRFFFLKLGGAKAPLAPPPARCLFVFGKHMVMNLKQRKNEITLA